MTGITQETFYAYETIRQSGVTNMFDVRMVVKIATEQLGVAMTEKQVIEIMKRYKQLSKTYNQ